MPNKILLVDDDREFREEFRDSLNEYAIVEAANGEEALNILKKPNDIDLVILDVKMPGINGTEVLKEMKDVVPGLGIVILTGHSSEDVAIEALKGHADDYIEKPLNIDKIKGVIDRLLESKSYANGDASGNETDKIEKVKSFAERNCYKKLCLKDAAMAVSLSPKYLSRIFKKNTGMGFSEYRLKIKIKEAGALLKVSGYNIDQISQKMGYENTESFIRMFKKITGYTPTEYRKKGRSKKAKGRAR